MIFRLYNILPCWKQLIGGEVVIYVDKSVLLLLLSVGRRSQCSYCRMFYITYFVGMHEGEAVKLVSQMDFKSLLNLHFLYKLFECGVIGPKPFYWHKWSIWILDRIHLNLRNYQRTINTFDQLLQFTFQVKQSMLR